MRHALVAVILMFAPFGQLFAQKDVIPFVNPSFEDLPRQGAAPVGWYDCGSAGETPPDIQPGQFEVVKLPFHGDTYLGLVVRDNDTWEAVAQRLPRSLVSNNCYEVSLSICRSEVYMSLSRTTEKQANYTRPARLQIWGGNGFCDRQELLWQSPDITHDRWLNYDVRLMPKKGNYTHLLFEAYFIQPTLFPYNGNILLDNLSSIRELDCNQKMDPGMKPKPVPPVVASGNGPQKPPKASTGGQASLTPSPRVEPPQVLESNDLKNKTLKKGDIIRVDKLYFDANQYAIKPEAERALQDILNYLRQHPRVVVEVGGHTNNRAAESFALDLSTNRARAVAEWLTERGVQESQVQYKGYGWKMPIQSNDTPEGRSRNQRVEFKIISTEG